MGGRGSGGAGAARGGGGAMRGNTPTRDVAALNQTANERINRLNGRGNARNTVFNSPSTGDTIQVTVDRVPARNFSGRVIPGAQASYTVRVDNMTTGKRLWYDYGQTSLARIKDDIRRVSGVRK